MFQLVPYETFLKLHDNDDVENIYPLDDIRIILSDYDGEKYFAKKIF